MKKLVIAFGLITAAAHGAALPDPVIWWKMDEAVGGKVPDASGNGRDLTLGPGMSLQESPLYGKSLVSDGTTNTWCTFAAPALGSRTLSFWLYRNATDSDPSAITDAQNEYPYLYRTDDLAVMFHAHSSSFRLALGSSGQSPFYDSGADRLRWNHHAFVITDTGTNSPATGSAVCNVTYYRNGVRKWKTDASVSGGFRLASSRAMLFNHSPSAMRTIYGAMDEFRLYDAALTAEQVAAEFRRPFETNPAKLIGHWKFDSTYVDSSTGQLMTPEATGLANPLKVGSAVVLTNGVHGNAFYFDGTANASAANTPNGFKILHDATITGWVNIPPEADQLSTIISGNSYPQIYCLGELSSRVEIQQTRTDRRLRMFWRNNEVAGSQYLGPYISCRGEWSHLAIAYTHRYDEAGGQWYCRPRMYVNGTLAATGEERLVKNSILLTDPTTRISFGNADFNAQRPILGTLDDMCIWSGALSAERIRELARSPAAIDAGDDFTVTGPTAELRAVTSAGTVEWTQVSGPAAAIETADAPVTLVTLPEEGTYVFRAATASETTTESDVVTVTRVAVASGNQAPAVSLAASAAANLTAALPLAASVSDPDAGPGPLRVKWSRVSGPGAVWFEPEQSAATSVTFSEAGSYVLACTASDGDRETSSQITVAVSSGAAASLTNGLARVYTADDPKGPFVESVSGTDCMASPDYTNALLVEGVKGLGFKAVGETSYFNSGKPLPETALSGTMMPANQYMTFSAWIYYDPSAIGAGRTRIPTIFSVPDSLALSYESPAISGGTGCFVMYLRGYSNASTANGTGVERYCFAPPSFDLANQWVHLCFVVERNNGSRNKLYLNGVALAKHGTSSYSTGWTSGYVLNNNFLIAGCDSTKWPNGSMKNLAEQTLYLGSFPGVIDDVRIWTRELSAAEAKELSEADKGMRPNHAPQVAAVVLAGGRRSITCKTSARLAATVFDDGLPAGADVSCEWEVVSGDAAAVTFSAPSSSETDVRVDEPGRYLFRVKVSDGDLTAYSAPLAVEAVSAGTIIVIR